MKNIELTLSHFAVTFPALSLSERMHLLDVPEQGTLPVVIDSDTYNEIDDQFAIAWALLRSDRLDLQAIYAAPFSNSMFDSAHEVVADPGVGMSLSYDEIERVLERMECEVKPAVFHGSNEYLSTRTSPETSPAVQDLINRAHQTEGVLQVVSIGAPTNIANALLIDPSIINKIHVLWLGGHSFDWSNTQEFNLMQDMDASRVLLNSGVALTLFPCMGVTNTLATTVPELQHYLTGTTKIGDYLAKEAPKCPWIGFANRKVVWDIAPIGYLVDADWYTTYFHASPVLNDNLTWSFDLKRHPIRVVKFIERDHLFVDMFSRLIEGK